MSRDDIYERISYAHDSLGWDLAPERIPLAVAKPVTTRQVSDLLKYANRERIPVYVQGAATAFKGSPRPKRSGSIILTTLGPSLPTNCGSRISTWRSGPDSISTNWSSGFSSMATCCP